MIRSTAFTLLLTLAAPALAQQPSGNAAIESLATSSPADMRAFAAEAIKTIKAGAAEVQKLTEQARKDSDAGVLDCLTPRNVSMQALVQVADGALRKMEEALTANDRERANHEYRKIAVSLDKAQSIRSEANNCLAGEGGRGVDDVNVQGGVGDDADTVDNDELDDLDVGFDPPPVSPFRP